MTKTSTIPIFMSCDSYFIPYTATAIASIMENRLKSTHCEIHVLTTHVEQNLIDTTHNWFKKYPNATLNFIDVDHAMDALGRERFHVTPDLPLATYFRFLAPTLFKQYPRIIYLDSDLIVLADLEELLSENLNGNAIGACHDIWQEYCYTNEPRFHNYFTKTLDMRPEDGYFNAGILLMDLDAMRSQNIQQQLLDAVDKIPQPYLKDQDILNAVCKNSRAFLHDKWNVVDWMADPSEKNETFHFATPEIQERCRLIRKNCAIVHYMGKKPWNADYAGTLDNVYWRYSKLTPFHNIALERLDKGCKLGPTTKTVLRSGFHMLRSAIGQKIGPKNKQEKNARRFYRFREEARNALTRRTAAQMLRKNP